MAACSELELEGKSSQEKRLLCSKSFDSTTNKDDAFNTQKACNSEMPKNIITIEQESKNTVDIGSLTEEQLQSLLEEATTFNRPKDEASSILRALRKQIKDSDDVKEAAAATGGSCAGSVPTTSVVSSVASHNNSSSKRKIRNSGNVPCNRSRLLLANDDTLTVDYSNRIQLSKNSDNVSGATGGNGGRRWVGNLGREHSSELQSQSLQDLASARFTDAHDSMRAAGIGRGNRRFQKAGRANSFTENSSEWTGLGAQMSTLDRTQGRAVKSTKPRVSASNRTSWTGQMVVNASDAENNNVIGISSSIAKPPNDPCALFNDCEYDVSSGDGYGGKHWSAGSSDRSSPDKEELPNTIPVSTCDTNDSGVSLLSCRPLSDNEFCPMVTHSDYGSLDVVRRRGGSPPLEIEMIDMAKAATFGEVGECGSTFVCNRIQDGFSDVDAPVLFPLKAGSSGHNNVNCSARPGPVNGIYQLQDRYRSIQSLMSPGGDGKDDIKFYQTVDFNPTNPLMRTMRIPDGSILTNFSTAGGNYSFEGAPSRNELTVAGSHGRKMKRTKSNAETGVKRAEDCDGYRGKDDIDSLVEFINSTDKNKTNQSHGANTVVSTAAIINTNTISGNNSSTNNTKLKGNGTATVVVSVSAKIGGLVLDSERKKVTTGKEKFFKGLKKKPNSSESADDEEAGEDVPQQISNSCMETDWEMSVEDTSTILDDTNSVTIKVDSEKVVSGKNLDSQRLKEHSESFASEVMKMSPLSSPPSSTSGSVITQSDEIVSSFVKDFYAVTDLSGQLMEESEFRVVVNKQRKRKQVKKPDSFRRYGNTCSNVPAGVGSGGSSERDYYLQESSCHHSMLLSGLPLSHRTQRGQSDFGRRKSTSSMPPSEPSSADNSDLDSVHSLPVSGTAPPPTGPHPHTTPSSMSSTPQASYADIARMSTQMTLTKGKGHEMLQPNNPGQISIASPEVTSPTSPNPPPTVSAAVQTSASDLDTSETETTSIDLDVPISTEMPVTEVVVELESRQSTEKTLPESSSSGCTSAQAFVTTKPTSHAAVSQCDFNLVNPITSDAKSSSGICVAATTEVLQNAEKSVFRSISPPVGNDSTLMLKTTNFPNSAAKSGNSAVIVLTKPNNTTTGFQKQCGPPVSGVVKQCNPPPAAVTTKHAGLPSVVTISNPNPSTVSNINNPAINNNPLSTPNSNQNPPSNPVAHMSSVPGPNFLQESTIVCQRLNQTVKPSPGKIETNMNRKTAEPFFSRTRPPAARSEGARNPAPPVITLDKSPPSAAISPPQQEASPSCLCDISFGVDMREILKLSVQGQTNPITFEFEQCSHHASDKESGFKSVPVVDTQGASSSSSHTSVTASAHVNTEATVCFSAHESSPEDSGNIVVVSGKRLQWKENEAETRNFNHSQVVNFFGTAWDSVIHDFEKDSTREGKKSGKVCYYSSYC